MPYLLLKKLPDYACLLKLAERYPDADPSAVNLFLHLLRAADEVFEARQSSFSRFNLSCGRFAVLMQLLDREQYRPITRTPAELADVAGVTRATITGLVDTLERDGLVKRQPDPKDRRMMAVHLTAKGEELLTRVLPNHFRLMTQMLGGLSEAERKTLVKLLAKILPSEKAGLGLDLPA